MIRITLDVRGLKRFVADLEKEINANIIPHSLKEAKAIIIADTRRGKDIDGKRFKKYSKAYARRKGQANVDLTATGSMLNNMDVYNKNTLKPESSDMDKAYAHNEGKGRQPERKFIGGGKNILSAIEKTVAKDIQAL